MGQIDTTLRGDRFMSQRTLLAIVVVLGLLTTVLTLS